VGPGTTILSILDFGAKGEQDGRSLETGAYSHLLKQPFFDLVKVGFRNATGV